MTRGSKRDQTGKIGEDEVTAALERLNWGVASNNRHDLGTDLLAMPRNERYEELSLLVGVQVKTRGVGEGPGKYFSEPRRDRASGEITGWWFRDRDRRHIDSWLRYDVPYLLVLHDANTRTSYWVHVTNDAVEPAGLRGAKILVPAHQTIDLDHRQQLLEVAASQRPRVGWEGSAWRGPETLAPSALLRHALIVPRLVAPHPNLRSDEPLTPEQALALLVRAQIDDIDERLGAGPFGDDRAKVLDLPGWRWQLVRALLYRLTTGEGTQLQTAADDATDPAERTAATVLAAATHLEKGAADAADDLLAAALKRDDAGPVDHAWLCLQRARCLGELGRVDQAREYAAAAQRIRTAYPDDLSATAIGGIGAMTLYRLTRWESGNFSEGITGLDTTAVWWRTLDMSDGLRAAAREAFRTWARDTATVWSVRDSAHDDLLAASLMAGYLGDQSAWRALSSLLAKEQLMRVQRTDEPDEARRALSRLRLCGDHKGVRLAARRLVRDGPATAAAQAASEIDLATATRTTAQASLALLRAAGDVLDVETADRSCAWLLATLGDPSVFRTRTQPGYAVVPELANTLAGVVGAASEDNQRRVAEHLADLTVQEESRTAGAWAGVARAIRRSGWEADTAARFGESASSHHDELRVVAHEIAARFEVAQRCALVPLIDTGSQAALSAFGDVRELPAQTARAYIDTLVTSCDRVRENARNNARSDGEPARDLAMFNAWHPDLARWDTLFDLLDDPIVWPQDKNRALLLLARVRAQIPDDEVVRLRELADRLLASKPIAVFALMGEDTDCRGAALELAYSLSDPATAGSVPAERRGHLLDLARGEPKDRRQAAYIARHDSEPSGDGLLTALVQDEDPAVRAEAACALLHRVRHESQPHSLASVALDRAVTDPGTLVAQGLAAALARPEATADSARRDELLRRLVDHPSAAVRHRVADALGAAVPTAGTDSVS